MNTAATAALLAILVIVAGLWYFVFRDMGEAPEPSDDFWFYKIDEDDIQFISVKTEDTEEAFSYREDQGWFFDGEKQPPVDNARWGGVTLVLSGPRVRRVLSEDFDDYQTYGLDPPTTVLDLGLRGERTMQLYLGKLTPDGSGYYAYQRDDDNLYVIEAIWGQVLRRLAFEPPYPQWFYRLDPARVLYLGVTKDEVTSHFVVEPGEGWRWANAERWPIDEERWAEVTPLLDGPDFLGIEAEHIDDLAKYGLLEPRSVIIIEYLPPEGIEDGNWESVLEIGAPTPEGDKYYARAQGQPFLLLIDAPWIETMERLVDNPPRAENSQPEPDATPAG